MSNEYDIKLSNVNETPLNHTDDIYIIHIDTCNLINRL
jgi:hypothetical protein